MSDDAITIWAKNLAAGDESAARQIWNTYFEKLVRLAKAKLGSFPKRMADEEDVAISAMRSFCRAAAAGRYSELEDRNGLWRLLLTITTRKAYRHIRDQKAEKRGGGKVEDEGAFDKLGGDGQVGIGEALGKEPTPELVAMFAEESGRMLEALGDDTLRQIANLKLEGFTNDEIAARLAVTTRTVERKLERIRSKWSKE